MTTTDRVAAIANLTIELIALTTDEERRDYPFLAHLTDLLEDLEEDS